MGMRRRAREIALQVLYQLDASQESPKKFWTFFGKILNPRAKPENFVSDW